MLFGFNLFLQKSNLVPETRQHELEFQLSRQDIRFDRGVMVAHIKWSKTNQFGNRPLFLPLILNKSCICPIKWCLFMLHRIPGKSYHNLFSFPQEGITLPI